MPDYSLLKAKFGDYCFFDEPAANFTTYRAGGRAEALVKPASRAEFEWLAAWCRAGSIALRVLGRGSNVLVSDRGLPGVTALTERMAKIEITGNTVTAQAGVSWDSLVLFTVEHGLAGIEKTSGIPGSVGGALRMNAGAFGQEAFDRLEQIDGFSFSGSPVSLEKKHMTYGYRRVDGLDGLIILSAGFSLTQGNPAVLLQDRSFILASRETKQPLDYPSAGSVFKRPPGDYASRLIDAAGLKGLKIGGAEVSAKHAGFIINSGGATAADICALMREVRARVLAKTGVALELEQILLGEF